MNLSQIARYPVTIEGETALIGTASELAIALDGSISSARRPVKIYAGKQRSEFIAATKGRSNVSSHAWRCSGARLCSDEMGVLFD